jgi:hypothetical protein
MVSPLFGSFEELTTPIYGFGSDTSDLQHSRSGDDIFYNDDNNDLIQGDVTVATLLSEDENDTSWNDKGNDVLNSDDLRPRSSVRHGLMVWFKSCRKAISQFFPSIDTPKLQPGEYVQDPNGWWYTIHPKTSRLIYADSRAELQKIVQELASHPAVRRSSPWF